MVGFFVSAGLAYLYLSPSAHYHGRDGKQGFRPWGGPTAAIVYAVISLFLLVTVFLRPAPTSPFDYSTTKIQWYILPAIGLSSLLWGVVWWAGLLTYGRIRGLELIVSRLPYFERETGSSDSVDEAEWVQRSEIIVHEWMSRAYVLGMEGHGRRDSDYGPGAPDLSQV
jgi:hypothetical protein